MEEPAIRQGVYVTAAYILVFYGCIIGQAKAKFKTLKEYKERGERVRVSLGVKSSYTKRVILHSIDLSRQKLR